MPFTLVGYKDLCQGLPNSVLLVVILGEGLWIIAYALIIWSAFRDKTYGVPLTAIALNYTWEILYTFVFPSPCWVVRLLRYGWFILDTVIVWQLVRFGRKDQRIPDFRHYYFIGLLVIFVMALIGHLTYHHAYQDLGGQQAAYGINFIMSILFVLLFYSRKDKHGLSYGAAWAKMLGTGILALATALSFISNPVPVQDFLLFLFVSIFLFDVWYIILFHWREPEIAAAATA